MNPNALIDEQLKAQSQTPQEQQKQTDKEAALQQSLLEKEGQYKLWLDMPQTKNLIKLLEKNIAQADKELDGHPNIAEQNIRTMLAVRGNTRALLVDLTTGSFNK